MEYEPTREKVASISLDTYLKFLISLHTLEGKVIEDDNHGFFVWLTNRTDNLQNIDGERLDTLYEKNVIEGGMTKERFNEYCVAHDFLPINQVEKDQLVTEYNNFLIDLVTQKKSEYKVWAIAQDIDVAPGAITKFPDSDGNIHRLYTDSDHYGEPVD